ncbi:hypothetical protein [Lichenicoccus roseus]|uniref:Uncharacterized protein n=1 Tax=Lichenicoccus roseus TaxID=2683649 RepID=A0A5R9J910_9PROT|nr:hypothetical protein [Lichenicoccus roseus]TLU73037.1 hypothetical protein FE263_06245 [Lichenicoccus roseus]
MPTTIRPALDTDRGAAWSTIGPVIRDGETYALDRDMTEAEAPAYWFGADTEVFVKGEESRRFAPPAVIFWGEGSDRPTGTMPTA